MTDTWPLPTHSARNRLVRRGRRAEAPRGSLPEVPLRRRGARAPNRRGRGRRAGELYNLDQLPGLEPIARAPKERIPPARVVLHARLTFPATSFPSVHH